jgi:4-amino-4-deoxy-L-arabinose transferase-like glycosyltransferase
MDDRDSAHFSQATKQMLETGNYFQIRYQDVTRYQKPPGINWLQALSVKAFSSPESDNVWPYRLPSVIGGWLSVLLTFFFAQKMCGRTVAFIAATLLASTVLLNIESHLATIDASLLVSVVLMQGALWIVYEKIQRHEPLHWKWPLIFFLSMAYGILLKGITPLVGFLTLITLSLIDKTTLYFKKIRIFWGILLLLILTAAWLIAVSYAENTNYLMQMINRDLLPKLAGGHESHGAPFGTHLALLVVTFWPASLFLWPTVVRTWQQRNKSIEKFLLAWIIPVWLFFEFMPTKLPQYILPIFPALAILGAYALMEQTAQDSRIMRILTVLWCLVSIGLAAAFLIVPIKLNLSLSTIPSAYWVSSILILTSLIAVICVFKKNYLNALIVLIFGNCLGFGIGYQCYLPQLTPVWASQHIKQAIEETIPGKISNKYPLISIGYAEPSLVFLLGTHAVKFEDIPQAIKNLNSSSYVLVDKDSQENFLSAAQANMLFPQPLQTITSFNYTKGHWVTLTLYRL